MLLLAMTKNFVYHINVDDNIQSLYHIMKMNSAFKELICWNISAHWKEVLIKVEEFSKQKGIK